MGSQEIRQLRDILNKTLDDLESVTARVSPTGTWPSLDKTTSEWAEPHSNQDVKRLSNIIVAAAYQLISVVREPFQTLADASYSSFLTSSIKTALELNIAEILREYGETGAHLDDIAKACGAHKEKLGRCLRVLATHHIFQEVKPNVFANNRISALLDTGVSHKELLESQLNKYTSRTPNPDFAAYAGHFADEAAKAATYHFEDVQDGNQEQDPNYRTPLQKAYNTELSVWDWMHEPFNKYRFSRHNACIAGSMRVDAPETILEAYDWNTLAPGSLVVDIGGGLGAPALALTRAFPHLKIVIQDLQATVENGINYWKRNYNEALTDGRVSFGVHSFFDPQPITGAHVFFARFIAHNWDDAHVVKMLKMSREAAAPHTRFVIADHIIPFASRGPVPYSNLIKTQGQKPQEIPSPLLNNLGKANSLGYFMDIGMEVLMNGKERTLPHFISLLEQANWSVVEVRVTPNTNFGFIIAGPA